MVLEAWARDREECFAHAVAALVSIFADVTGRRPDPAAAPHHLRVAPGPDAEQLVTLLEEVLFLLDARGVVPVRAVVRAGPEGGLDADFEVVPVSDLPPVGAVPKAVTWHRLAVERSPRLWRCRVLVDV